MGNLALGTSLARVFGIEGGEMSYTVYPVIGFLGVLLVGGITLIADAGVRLIRDLRSRSCGIC